MNAKPEEKLAEVGESLKDTLEGIGYKLVEVRDGVVGKSKDYWKATDSYVGSHPWTAVGIGAGIAFLTGVFLARRNS